MVCCHVKGPASVSATALLSVCVCVYVSIFDSHLLMTLSQRMGGASVYVRRAATQHTDVETRQGLWEKAIGRRKGKGGRFEEKIQADVTMAKLNSDQIL